MGAGNDATKQPNKWWQCNAPVWHCTVTSEKSKTIDQHAVLRCSRGTNVSCRSCVLSRPPQKLSVLNNNEIKNIYIHYSLVFLTFILIIGYHIINRYSCLQSTQSSIWHILCLLVGVGPFGIRDPLRWGVPRLGWSHDMVVIIDKIQMIKTMFEFSNNS